MKVTINVDCTPEEARTFLGLPDIAPLQQEMMAGWRAQMEKAAQTMNPEDVMKTIFPAGTDGLADMQKAFWSSFTGTSKKS
jgi:hypothetical protein